jgi:hypothetical protein
VGNYVESVMFHVFAVEVISFSTFLYLVIYSFIMFHCDHRNSSVLVKDDD